HQGRGRHPQGARPLPRPGGGAGLLRRLRRDRPLRGRRRAGGVRRRMSFTVEPPPLPVPKLHDEELAELNREFERLSAPKIIQWAIDTFSPHLCLAASMQDAVLIDLATKV